MLPCVPSMRNSGARITGAVLVEAAQQRAHLALELEHADRARLALLRLTGLMRAWVP